MAQISLSASSLLSSISLMCFMGDKGSPETVIVSTISRASWENLQFSISLANRSEIMLYK